jgi:hypothetical protein
LLGIDLSPITALDDCHLKGPYGGHLLCAVDRGENDYIFPIAHAVVEIEYRDSRTWFMGSLLDGIFTFCLLDITVEEPMQSSRLPINHAHESLLSVSIIAYAVGNRSLFLSLPTAHNNCLAYGPFKWQPSNAILGLYPTIRLFLQAFNIQTSY